ncbi:hypothetical protein [uncultured Robinsoniella sp.]|uniref:hypothetical protein n=1 Tax=uncultured Robinsoniella sp. TaxID=904190 RepID=UPI00374FBC66
MLYELSDDDKVEVCNVNAPITKALGIADVTIIKQGVKKENRNSKLMIMFDTRNEEKEW